MEPRARGERLDVQQLSPAIRWLTLASPVLIMVVAAVGVWAGVNSHGLPAALAGVVLGLIVAFLPGEVVRAGLVPLGRLGLAVLPLALPLIVIVLVGSPALPTAVQLVAIPLLILIAWRLILVREWPDFRAAVADFWTFAKGVAAGLKQRHLVRDLVLTALFAAVLVALFVFLFPRADNANQFRDRPGTSTVILAVGTDLWLFAIVFRLIGFGTSLLRLIVGSLAIALIAWGALWLGILPGYDTFSWAGTPLLVAFLALGAFTIVAEGAAAFSPVARKWVERLSVKEDRGRWAAALGYGAAVLAALALAVAGVASAIEVRQVTKAEVAGGGADKTERVIPPAHQSNRVLARTYAPTLVFTPGERWWPVRTSVFSHDPGAELIGRYVLPGDNPPTKLPKRCPNLVPEPCFDLTIHCGDGSNCADPPGHPKRAVYVRIIRDKPGAVARRGPDPFDTPAGRFEDSPTILIQYWLFYRYNDWSRPVLTGRLSERHEGDWEAITVGLSNSRPLFVGYSEHCGGYWRPWGGVKVGENPTGPKLNPLVAVAQGSHANYAESQERRSPDWAGCAGLPDQTTTLLSYASNIRDKTEDGPTWRPTGSSLIIVKRGRPPMNFPGRWGLDTKTELLNSRRHTLAKSAGGPETPSLQPLWINPFGQIFCSPHWRPRECPKQ